MKNRIARCLSVLLCAAICAALLPLAQTAQAEETKIPEGRVQVDASNSYTCAYNAAETRFDVAFKSLDAAQELFDAQEGSFMVNATAPEGDYTSYICTVSTDDRPSTQAPISGGLARVGITCFSGDGLLAGTTITARFVWDGGTSEPRTETVEFYIVPLSNLKPVEAARLSVITETLFGLAGTENIALADGLVAVTVPDGSPEAWGAAYITNPDGNAFDLRVQVTRPADAERMAISRSFRDLADYEERQAATVRVGPYARVNQTENAHIVVMRESETVFFLGLQGAEGGITYETFTVRILHANPTHAVELAVNAPAPERVVMNRFLGDAGEASLSEGSVRAEYASGTASFVFLDADTLLANPENARLGLRIAPPAGFTPGSEGFSVTVNGAREATPNGRLYITQRYRDGGALITNTHSDTYKINWTQGEAQYAEVLTFNVTCLTPYDTWMDTHWDPIPQERISLSPGYEGKNVTAAITGGHIAYACDAENMPSLDTLTSGEYMVMVALPEGAVYYRWAAVSFIEYDESAAQDVFDRLLSGTYPGGGIASGNARGDRFHAVTSIHGDGNMHLSNSPTLGLLLQLDGLDVCLSCSGSTGVAIEWYDAEFNRIGARGEYISWTIDPFLYESVTAAVAEVNAPVTQPTIVADDPTVQLVCSRFPQAGAANEYYVQLENEGEVPGGAEVYLPYGLLSAGLTYESALGRTFTLRHYNDDHTAYETLTGEVTPFGLRFVTTSFSPFLISYTDAPAPQGDDTPGQATSGTTGIAVLPSATDGTLTPPPTGDEGLTGFACALLLLACALGLGRACGKPGK